MRSRKSLVKPSGRIVIQGKRRAKIRARNRQRLNQQRALVDALRKTRNRAWPLRPGGARPLRRETLPTRALRRSIGIRNLESSLLQVVTVIEDRAADEQ